MKGVTFLEDTTNNKKLVQIDLAILQKNDDEYLGCLVLFGIIVSHINNGSFS